MPGMQSRLIDAPSSMLQSEGHWELDDASSACRLCERPFTLLRRRHHCRSCGRLTCGRCSPESTHVQDPIGPPGRARAGYGNVRVCSQCASSLVHGRKLLPSARLDALSSVCSPRCSPIARRQGSREGDTDEHGSPMATPSPLRVTGGFFWAWSMEQQINQTLAPSSPANASTDTLDTFSPLNTGRISAKHGELLPAE